MHTAGVQLACDHLERIAVAVREHDPAPACRACASARPIPLAAPVTTAEVHGLRIAPSEICFQPSRLVRCGAASR